jgi:hypothetical protein
MDRKRARSQGPAKRSLWTNNERPGTTTARDRFGYEAVAPAPAAEIATARLLGT